MAATPASAEFPYAFVVVTFAVSIAIGLAIIYIGAQGHLGWGIP